MMSCEPAFAAEREAMRLAETQRYVSGIVFYDLKWSFGETG